LFTQYCRFEAVQPVREEELPREEWTELPKEQQAEEHPLVILNVTSPEKFPTSIKSYLKHNHVQSAFAIEIKYRRVVFGRLVLHQCSYPRIWTGQEISFLEILATHIGAALYQVKLYQQEKQAKQEAEEANRQKSKVLSFVSHDFKNPLASMKRFIDILENDKSDLLSEKHRELIEYIAEGVYQLRNMVMDILDKARLDEGRITPITEWIEVRSFIDELKPMFSSMASQRNIKVSLECQPELTALKADPTHLRQILINLVSNAVKYNRMDGEAFLRLYKSEDGQSAVIEVQDTGLGISEEKIPQLFTEYFRGDLSQSNLVEGTGLGLAFIKKLIELHGGSIVVESEVGVGSTFKVMLPFMAKNHDRDPQN
ncbi:MAG TPA: GAF domain-containing sensor histidine kinase, partial [Pseudobdellovibrionaceae bacterium]